MNFIRKLPWQLKLAGSLMIGLIPMRYNTLQRMNLFKCGKMDDIQVAYDVFRMQCEESSLENCRNLTILELGPGDSLFTAMIAYAFGASQTYLVDVGSFANRDMTLYENLGNFLVKKHYKMPDISKLGSIDDLLPILNAKYLTSGLESLRSIPDNSVDFILSNAVLEHIHRSEFVETMKELRRIITPNGICIHIIDLKDHFERNLQHLRVPEIIWESPLMKRSAVYTNRIRYSQMLRIFQGVGFSTEIVRIKKWVRVPLPKHKLNKEFRSFSDENLRIASIQIVLKPR